MSTNKSQNLKLHLWEPEDNFLRTEFNENFAALDSAVKAEETARKNAVTSLQSSVNAKASTSALNTAKSELTTKINTAQSTANTAKTTAEAAFSPSNPYHVTGSYTGTGVYGKSNKNSINVGFMPSLVILFGGGSCKILAYPGGVCNLERFTSVSWTNTGVEWYNSTDAETQFNVLNYTYSYTAFR